MNKIQVDSLVIDNKIIELDIKNDIDIYLKGNSTCYIKSLNNAIMNIYLTKDSNSLIEFLGTLNNNYNKITIYNEENSILNFNFASNFINDNELEINSILNNSNIVNNIKLRLVESIGNIKVIATGNIKENTTDINYLEDIKAIVTNNKNITIIPNLLVSSENVIANHNTTISNISNKDLFYLQSKGIDKDMASDLIKKGFLKEIIKGGEFYE